MRRTIGVAFFTLFAGPAIAPAQVAIIGQDFRGSNLTNGQALTGFSYAPPDCDGTVGPNHYVEWINGVFAVYAKTGNPTNGSAAAPITRISDTSFWNGVINDGSYSTASGLSDTHIRFDPNSNRYYAAEITTSSTNNRVLIARTEAGADPSVLTNWKATSYVAATSNFGDYPTLGFDANAVYVSTNNFTNSSGSFVDTTLTSIPKSDLNASTAVVTNRTQVRRAADGSATGAGFTPEPVVDWGPTKGKGVWIGTVTTGTLVVTNPTGTGSAGATYGAPTDVPVSSFSGPPRGRQPTGTSTLDALDGRMVNAAYQVGNDIWAVHSINGGATFGNRAALRWYHLDYPTDSVIASGMIGDVSGLYDYFNPSIAANANGALVLSFTRSGTVNAPGTATSGNAGAYAIVGTWSGATTSFGAPIELQDGLVTSYTGGRWGDLSQVSVDPNDTNTFWLINEFAQTSSIWADNITQLTVVPEPATFVLTASATGVLLMRRRRRAPA